MGGEVATNASDEFKALEMEMDLRHQGTQRSRRLSKPHRYSMLTRTLPSLGMDRLSASSNAYIKSLSKRDCGEGKEKTTAIAYFGNTLTAHGDDFEADSEFGQCLLGLGRANERIARLQETYTANATGSWIESVERSLIQMKEYQAARKRLDSRRLAYDTASAKMQRSKKEDFRMEEELRSQKAKYEESNEEVVRRMLDIKEAERDSVADLTSFLDTELAYYDRCREILVQLKRDWPAASPNCGSGGMGGSSIARSDTSPAPSLGRSISRRNTATTLSRSRASSINAYGAPSDDGGPLRPTISNGRLPSGQNSPRRELPGFDLPARPPQPGRRASGFEGPTSRDRAGSMGASRDLSPAPPPAMPRLSRVPTEPGQIVGLKNNLRSTGMKGSMYGDQQQQQGGDGGGVFADDASEVSESPSTYGNGVNGHGWQSGSMIGQDGSNVGAGAGGKKVPPPPP